MKSIQTKILILILSSILVSSFAVVYISITNYDDILEENSAEIMKLLCAEKEKEIDEQLLNIEQSVKTIYHFALGQMSDAMELSEDEEALHEYVEKVKEVILNAAKNTEGAVAAYYRFNPELFEADGGVFIVRNEDGQFRDFELTNITLYEKDDIEHVGWYYIPIENGKETWMDPYYNKNMDIEMISYIIPVFQGDTVIGIIGMDIELSELYKSVESVTVYNTGYAFLLDSVGNIVFHRDFSDGIPKKDFTEKIQAINNDILDSQENNSVVKYEWDGIKKRLASEKLRNGMTFAVCVPESEILMPQRKMLSYSMILIAFILCIAIYVTVQVTKVMVRPLKELTKAARKIANVDLDVSIECNSKDEVGILAQSFQQTAEHLRHYVEYINHLAYTDVLTGLCNKTAYEECVDKLNKTIEEGNAEFTLFVMDINDLKVVNDNFGHDRGDMLIKNASNIMKRVWKSDIIYRIGGDEFVVILSGENRDRCLVMISDLKKELERYNRENKVAELFLQIAVGMECFNKETDKAFSDVFQRADALMYEDKKYEKQMRSDS